MPSPAEGLPGGSAAETTEDQTCIADLDRPSGGSRTRARNRTEGVPVLGHEKGFTALPFSGRMASPPGAQTIDSLVREWPAVARGGQG